ncbi:hypothetical protein L7F22_040603 [Adiantum nelumboides]|nr:hypothetical protein [Adiantum nelumboides]
MRAPRIFLKWHSHLVKNHLDLRPHLVQVFSSLPDLVASVPSSRKETWLCYAETLVGPRGDRDAGNQSRNGAGGLDSSTGSSAGAAACSECVPLGSVVSGIPTVYNSGGYQVNLQGNNGSPQGFLVGNDVLEGDFLTIEDSVATKQKDNWVRKKFDAWRKMCGLEQVTPLEKLDLRVLNDMLARFFAVVCEQGGGLFPSDTLMGMLRCFGRLVKKEQDLRIASTGNVEVPFDIVWNPILKSTQNAVLGAMRRSVAAGVCKETKKAPVIGVTMEQEILHVEGDKNLLYLFLQPINSPRTQVWYNRNSVSVKVLRNIVKCIGERTGTGGNFSNKRLRSTCVTRMSLGHVPREVDCVVVILRKNQLLKLLEKMLLLVWTVLLEKMLQNAMVQMVEVSLLILFQKQLQVVVRCCCVCFKWLWFYFRWWWQFKSKFNNVTTGSFAGGADPSALIAGKSASNVGNDGGNGCSRPGVWFILYKLGDDIPFDENVLHELPAESARAMGVGGRAAISMFLMCNMSNCVVNVYVGKENIPFQTLDK